MRQVEGEAPGERPTKRAPFLDVGLRTYGLGDLEQHPAAQEQRVQRTRIGRIAVSSLAARLIRGALGKGGRRAPLGRWPRRKPAWRRDEEPKTQHRR